ncbi:Pkinase-domain-containing protein [Trametes polyzona]|nr:Pkinase-domain-containing protein [Trametes polyzona]
MSSTDTAVWIPEFLGKTIDDGRLRLVEVLGEGAYGVVFRAIDEASAACSSTPEPRQFAVKIMEKADPHSRRWRYQQREVAAHLRVADHEHVVTVHGAYECEYFIYIVLELCAGGDLFEPMIERQLYARNDALLKSVFVQLLDAVAYCHEHGVYHRDLKPDNILTNEDGTEVKIADFGLSTSAKVSDTFGCGSTNYMSPECIGEDYDFHPYSTEAADIWSLGIILTNLVAGRNPWDQATTSDKNYLKYLAHPGFLRSVLPISEETEDILHNIFTSDPGTRITLPELRERILAVERFTMTDAEIARASKWVQIAAASYFPPTPTPANANANGTANDLQELVREQSVLTPQDALRLLEEEVLVPAKFVICSSGGVSSGSDSLSSSSSSSASSSESKGPITPATFAQDQAKLVEVPDFKESEKIGAAMVPDIRKGRSLPMYSDEAPLVITFAL